jgi:hypothetical protein
LFRGFVGGALSHMGVPLEVQGAHSEPVKGIVLYEYCVGPVRYTLYLDVLGRVRPRFKEPPRYPGLCPRGCYGQAIDLNTPNP